MSDNDVHVCSVGFVERRGCHSGVLRWTSSAGGRCHLPCFSRSRDGMDTKGILLVTRSSSDLPALTDRHLCVSVFGRRLVTPYPRGTDCTRIYRYSSWIPHRSELNSFIAPHVALDSPSRSYSNFDRMLITNLPTLSPWLAISPSSIPPLVRSLATFSLLLLFGTLNSLIPKPAAEKFVTYPSRSFNAFALRQSRREVIT